MIIKHHTSIHAIIHEEKNRTKLEQYTKHMKQQVKMFQRCSTRRYEHRHEKHANQSYDEKDTSTNRFASKRNYRLYLFELYKTCIRYFREIP